MTARTASVAVCLAVLLVVSVPAGVAAASNADGSGESAEELETDEDSGIGPICIPGPALQDIDMNAHQQDAEALQTVDGTVTTGGAEPAREETFRIESDAIAASETCFADLNPKNGVIELQLDDPEFEDTSLIGPRTNIEFAEGEADSMTVVLPYKEAIHIIAQLPTSIDVVETLRILMEEKFGSDVHWSETDDGGTDEESSDDDDLVDDPPENATDPVENTTDAVDDATDVADDTINRTTDAVDDTVDETTDIVDETTNDSLENTTDAVDDTVDNTTDAVDETLSLTTSVVDRLVGTSTDGDGMRVAD